MAAGNWFPHNESMLWVKDGTVLDFSNTAMTIHLFEASVGSTISNLAVMSLSSVGNRGITPSSGGQIPTTVQGITFAVVNQSTIRFDATDVVITAQNTTIKALYAAIVSTLGTAILAVSTLDTGGTEVNVTTGGTLTIQFAATGILQETVTQA